MLTRCTSNGHESYPITDLRPTDQIAKARVEGLLRAHDDVLVLPLCNLLVQVWIAFLLISGDCDRADDWLPRIALELVHTSNIIGLLNTQAIEWYNLKGDLAGKHRECLEDQALPFTCPRNHEHVTLTKDEGVHGVDLDILWYTTRTWMKQVKNFLQALLDYVPVELLSLLPETGIVDELLYCKHVD